MHKRLSTWLLPGLLFYTLVAPQTKANESKSNLRWYLGIAGGNNTLPTDNIPDAAMIVGGKDILTGCHTKFMEVRCLYLVLLNCRFKRGTFLVPVLFTLTCCLCFFSCQLLEDSPTADDSKITGNPSETGNIVLIFSEFDSAYAYATLMGHSNSTMFKVGSGDTLAYEPATYGHVGILTWKAENSQNNWYYGITNYNPFDINAGSTNIFYFGGNLTVTINSDWSSYIPGQKLLLTNTFFDGYGNELHRVKFGKKHFWEDNTLVYPVIRVWNPNGDIIVRDSSENIFYNDSWPVNLPSDAVEGEYKAELSLNTGPHQGIIADTVIFSVSQEATSGGISYRLCDFDSAWAWATPVGTSHAPMFKITNGEILAFSSGDYHNVGVYAWRIDGSDVKWFYGISNYDHFVISEGSIDTFYFGGNFTIKTETDCSSYYPQDTVFIANTYTDNFENIVHTVIFGENVWSNNSNNTEVYPSIKVYNTNGVTVYQDSCWCLWTPCPVTLPHDAIEGEYTVELKLNTGPHQGILTDTTTFTVERE